VGAVQRSCKVLQRQEKVALEKSSEVPIGLEAGELGFEPNFSGLSRCWNGVELVKKGLKN
jgi:hypothetical protein